MRLGRSSFTKGGREPGTPKPPFPAFPGGAVSPGGADTPTTREPDGRPAPTVAGPTAPALGQLLLRQGTLVATQLASALQAQTGSGKRLGELLIELGIVAEQDLVSALAEQFRLPLADLHHRLPALNAPELLGESMARGLGAIPLTTANPDVLDVAISDPTVQEEVRRAFPYPVRLLLTSPGEVQRAVDKTYRALIGVDREVAAFSSTTNDRSGLPRFEMERVSDDAPIVRIVTMIITQALRDRASDVHIEPQDGRLRVRYRIDGALHEILELPGEMAAAVASRIKIMAEMNIVERRRPQDGQIATTVDGRSIDIRVASTGTIWGEKIVLRILDKSRSLFKLQDLGMPESTHIAYSRMIRSPYGMVICAGPTGSGKTTTLYASLSEVNGPERNITTIEDPVEYVFPSINQIQINETAGITFAGGLKSILRQDPDLILVGEMRDAETSRIAVQSALTGHFVLSSLHATDAVAALYRFLDMGIESFLVASSVLGIVGQRLVRRSCTYCRVRYAPSADEMAFFAEAGGNVRRHFWHGEGCHFCSGTGYSDRIGVYELLTVTERMRELIVQPNPSHDAMRRLAIEQGMQPLRAEAVRLVHQDETTIAEIVRSIYTL
jgi:type IV pilus assembly protein PilB